MSTRAAQAVRRTVVCAAVFAAAARMRGAGSPATPGELERRIPELMRAGDVPGLQIALVRDGKVAWRRAFGVRDASSGAPVADDTIFEAASLSKPVFAYAVLRLVDAGTIDLDAPIAKYLPGDYSADPRAAKITARNALTHTTGFPNWRSSPRELPMHFAPGERFSYSGEGFEYLQHAVERVTGQTLDEVMRRLVFEPLGMKDSRYSWDPRFDGRKATGHDEVGLPKTPVRPAISNAAATLETTASDYARFVVALMEGTGLSPRLRAEMAKPQVHVDEGCSNCVSKKPTGRLSKELAWGLGIGVEETDGRVFLWHWGDNGSGFHAFVLAEPAARSAVVIFTNSLGGHGIIPDIATSAVGGRHPAFDWIDYERWDSPARTWFRDVLAGGAEAATAERAAALTETQVNRVGYWLLAKKRTKEAIAVFERNTSAHADSWNAWDSLGEAYADDGQRDRAIAAYEKSVSLNPENGNGREALKRLRDATAGSRRSS
jgi:CubicO group peptidase (beta-lactamase class C family)